jgi:hypothetical protein
MDHLAQAKKAATAATEHAAVPELSRASTQRGIMHALIDIAESLRTLRPTQLTMANSVRIPDNVVPLAGRDDNEAAS